MAGWESNGAVQVARLWRNGQGQDLSDGARGALATGVAVSGQDVYVSGGVDGGTFDVATYWRNGLPVALSDGTSQAFGEAIAVSGEDIYVAGYRSPGGPSIATVWKNGESTALTDGTSNASALAVAVSGGDVYVAGFEIGVTEAAPRAAPTYIAKVWRNGVATALSDGVEPAVASSVVVAGRDVYVAGRVEKDGVVVATVWRNGTQLPLTDGTYGAVATGVAVDGGEVLVSGVENDGVVDVAKVWRDGVPMDLTSAAWQDPERPAMAMAVAAASGDAYTAGYHGRSAVYWKNGTEIVLTDGSLNADARAIAVVARQ